MLFEHDGLCEGICLFKNQSDLAREILAIERHESGTIQVPATDKKLASIRAYVNQALNRRRPFSEKLRHFIVQAVQRRQPSTVDQGMLENRLKEAIDAFATVDCTSRVHLSFAGDLARPITKDDLEFLLGVVSGLDSLPLGLALELLHHRKPTLPS